MSKWISRKLFVAIVAVVAIVWGIKTGDPAVEGEIIEKGTLITESAIALISMVYIVVQGWADGKAK